MTQPPLDPAGAFAALGNIRLSETDLHGVLDRVAHLAKRTIPGVTEVSVTLVRKKDAHTAAYTGDLAVALDEWQYERGHGPCLHASAVPATVSVPDMNTELRWPDYAARALDTGVTSSLSIGLMMQEGVTGALNVYGAEAQAFDNDAIVVAQTFAGYATVAIANAHLYEAQATLAQQMQAAMESRAIIEQAKGIVMGDRRCSADEAFGVLNKLSQDTNRKLREVAEVLVTRAATTPRP